MPKIILAKIVFMCPDDTCRIHNHACINCFLDCAESDWEDISADLETNVAETKIPTDNKMLKKLEDGEWAISVHKIEGKKS